MKRPPGIRQLPFAAPCRIARAVKVAVPVMFAIASMPATAVFSDAGEDLLQQQRGRELQRRLEPSPDVRFERPVDRADAGLLPEDESPCFVVRRLVLKTDGAGNGPWDAWAADAADRAADGAPDPATGRCLGTRGINLVMKRIQSAIVARGYRVMFREAPRFYKATCAAGDDCINNPAKVKIEPVTGTPQEIQAQIAANTDPNTVLAVNGIQNSIERGVELAFQNAAPIRVDSNGNQIQDPTKPTTIYLMHYQPANSTVGELLVSGYEKLLTSVDRGAAAILGYTNSDIGYADALQARGDKSTMSLGHSRGTLVQTNSFDILNERGFTNEQLSARGVGGAIGVDRYTESATSAGAKDRNVAFNYFANDPVAVIAGGNPGNTGISTLRDLWTVMTGGPNTQHSCYGTGAPGCKQVETPVHGGPQGTPEGNALLIEYQSGERVDKNPVARDLQERAR